MNLEDRAAIEPYLIPGERLLWAGRPDPSKHFSANDLYTVPFSIVWFGFTIFWTALAATSKAPFPFLFFGLVFVAVGIYFTVGRFVVKATRKKSTRYGVTTGRLLAVRPGSVDEASLRGLPAMSTVTARSGHVSVVVNPPTGVQNRRYRVYENSGLDFLTRGSSFGFFDVADGDALKAAIRDARAAVAADR
ncbi:hypothetical protein [Schumannella luteola]